MLIGGLRAQELTELQALTPTEFDDYLLVEAAAEPAQRVRRAKAFLQRWPATALASPVGAWLLESYRALNQGDDAIRAGEAVIEQSRDYVPALIGLCELLVNLRTSPADLARADELARRVLQLVDGGIDVPRHVPLSRWLPAKRDYEARAWSAIGQAEFKRGRPAEALQAFARAIQDEPVFDAARHLRYGLLLQSAGRRAEAARQFEAVLQQGPEALKERARIALRTTP